MARSVRRFGPWIDRAARGSLVLATTALTFPRLICAPGTVIDSSWIIGINLAVRDGLVFGRDVAFTYGPLGFVIEPLNFDSLLPHVVAWRLGLHGLWWLALGLAAFRMRGFAAAAVFLAVPTMTSDFFEMLQVHWLTTVVILLIVSRDPRARHWAVAATFLSAAAVLAKFNIGIACTVTLIVWGLLTLRRLERREALRLAGRLAAVFLVTLVGLYTAYGGPPWALPGFMYTSFLIARGYSAQASLAGQPGDLLLAGLMMLPVGLAAASGCLLRRRYAPVILLLAFPLFSMFKAGFVRHDWHALLFFVGAAELVSLLLMVAVGRWERLAWCITLATMVHLTVGWRMSVWPSTHLFNRGLEHLAQALNWSAARQSVAEQTQRDLQVERLPDALRARIGAAPADAYPLHVSQVLANGLAWRPRGVIQSYSAYDPTLDAAGAAVYSGPGAPTFVLYKHQAVDGQHPCAVDPQTWLALLRWYDVFARWQDTLVLERRAAPRFGDPVEIGRGSVRLGEPWQVPGEGRTPIMLKARFELTGLGRLTEFGYKVIPPDMVVTFGDGAEQRHRLVWRNTAEGFFISHLPRRLEDAAALFGGRGNEPVKSVRFEASAQHFQQEVALAWHRLK